MKTLPEPPARVLLVVEDSDPVAALVARAVEQERLGEPVVARNLREAALALSQHPNIVAATVDWGLPDGQPTMLLAALEARGIPRVIYTGLEDEAAVVEAGVPVVYKSEPLGILLAWLRRAIEAKQAEGQP